jgi:hypothetical protein
MIVFVLRDPNRFQNRLESSIVLPQLEVGDSDMQHRILGFYP